MATKRQEQISQQIQQRAADYLQRESNRQSLVTVTRADVSPDLKNVLIFISVLPTEKEQEVLHFAKRNRTDFRDYLKSHSMLKFLPNVDFDIDYGEKNRQRIDDLTRS